MEKKEVYIAVSVEDELPPFPQIVVILLDGRLPMMAQRVPDENNGHWESVGIRKVIEKGITHWLKPITTYILTEEEKEAWEKCKAALEEIKLKGNWLSEERDIAVTALTQLKQLQQ